MVEKYDFLQVVRIPYPKKGAVVFPWRGWFSPVSTLKLQYFNEKMSSLAGLKKSIQFSARVPILGIFDSLGLPSKSIFSIYSQKFEKPLVNFLGEVVTNTVLKFELSIFKTVRRGGGASSFKSRHFPKSFNLASCEFVEADICSLLNLFYCLFSFLRNTSFHVLVVRLIFPDDLLEYKRKTSTLDDFMLFWAFVVQFLSSLKSLNIFHSSFQGH